jgi:hypothetical protein
MAILPIIQLTPYLLACCKQRDEKKKKANPNPANNTQQDLSLYKIPTRSIHINGKVLYLELHDAWPQKWFVVEQDVRQVHFSSHSNFMNIMKTYHAPYVS